MLQVSVEYTFEISAVLINTRLYVDGHGLRILETVCLAARYHCAGWLPWGDFGRAEDVMQGQNMNMQCSHQEDEECSKHFRNNLCLPSYSVDFQVRGIISACLSPREDLTFREL